MSVDVTVVILSRNRLNFLIECLKSVTAQKGKNYNIIVSENSTTDTIFKYIKQNYKDIKIIKRANLSSADHFMTVISECSTEFIVIFHDDDIMLPNYINDMHASLAKNIDYSAIACNAYINRKNKNTYQKFFYHPSVSITTAHDLIKSYCRFSSNKPAPFPSYMYRTKYLKEYMVKPEISGKYSDVITLMGVLNKGNFLWLSKCLMEYRIHKTNDSGSESISDRKKLLNYFSGHVKQSDEPILLLKYRLKYLFRIKVLTILKNPRKYFISLYKYRRSCCILFYYFVKCCFLNLKGVFTR